MKAAFLNAPLLVGLLGVASCSPSTDSTKTADNANDKKIEKADSAGAQPATATSTGDAKDVADYMVSLANTGRSEYELSKVAATRATSSPVKQYASKTVTQHAQDEKDLQEQATKYNITLPTALSTDSQDMLTSLGKEKTGADFDRKYLDDMADVNDKAISKAKGLVSNTSKPELQTFIQKIMSDDQKHMAEAKALKDAIK